MPKMKWKCWQKIYLFLRRPPVPNPSKRPVLCVYGFPLSLATMFGENVRCSPHGQGIKCKKTKFTHTVESTVCDESRKKKVDDTEGRGTSYTVDSTVCVNIGKSGGLGWTWSPGRIPPPTDHSKWWRHHFPERASKRASKLPIGVGLN